MDWHQIWEIISAPDNVPIVGLVFLITWRSDHRAKPAAPSLSE